MVFSVDWTKWYMLPNYLTKHYGFQLTEPNEMCCQKLDLTASFKFVDYPHQIVQTIGQVECV